VIAIIAILLSILLPGLGSARDAARKVACQSNLRQLALAFNNYALSNDEWLPGSPSTSGFDTLPANDNSQKGYIKSTPQTFNGITWQNFDYMGPLADQFGVPGPGRSDSNDPADLEGRSARFRWLRELEEFRCPSNDFLVPAWDGGILQPDDPHWPIGQMISYNTSTQFMTVEGDVPHGGGTFSAQDRSRYKPTLALVGTPYMKGVLHDGHRFATQDPDVADHDIGMAASFGGAMSSAGPWIFESKSLNRIVAPGESGNILYNSGMLNWVDRRPMAFRHGPLKFGDPIATKQAIGNVAFFDGHVESMTDAEATDPDFWFPTGTRITSGGVFWNYTNETWPDKTKNTSQSNPYLVP